MEDLEGFGGGDGVTYLVDDHVGGRNRGAMQAMLVCGFEEASAWGWWAQKESEEIMGNSKRSRDVEMRKSNVS